MLLKNDITITPKIDIRFLQGVVLLQHDQVALVASRVSQDVTDIHFYVKDKLVHTKSYNQEICNFGTINRTELLVLLPMTGEWLIINSSTYEETKGKFAYRNRSPFKSRLLFFPESKVVCIYEMGDFADKSAKFTFMNYPLSSQGKDFWQTSFPDCFNHTILPLNLRNRVAVFSGRVDDKIRWSIIDIEKRAVKQYSVNKPGDGSEYCFKGLCEMRDGVYLMSIEAANADLRYLVYDENSQEPPRKLKVPLSDKVYDIMAVGGWIYVLEFEVDANGNPQDAPLKVISKDTEELVFEDKCRIGGQNEYYVGTTSDRFIIRVEALHHHPKQIRIESLRATSQRELYVHLLKEITHNTIKLDMVQYVLDAFEEDGGS